MKNVSVLQQCLVSFMTYIHPSHVLVLIVFDKVSLLLKGINKGHPSGFSPEWHKFIRGVPLLVTFPPRYDMGKRFME
jgi:hypothetical protein